MTLRLPHAPFVYPLFHPLTVIAAAPTSGQTASASTRSVGCARASRQVAWVGRCACIATVFFRKQQAHGLDERGEVGDNLSYFLVGQQMRQRFVLDYHVVVDEMVHVQHSESYALVQDHDWLLVH